ncbi:HlyD family efflux transporter periplasmic adaptor subunit [Thalassoglobus sp. JC818]|uniref:HlyD family efflux transporter periplasmic adaptor subunit n=1 Tax=Thalassoglobus sp. JC818 TaxID=3232136 RepID=UPI00345A8100
MDTDRPIPWKMRFDLQVSESITGGRLVFVVKDPITLQYFSLTQHEYDLLSNMNGQLTTNDAYRQYNAGESFEEFTAELKEFLKKLVSQNLVVSTLPGYSQLVARRATAKTSQPAKLLARLNVITIRWRGLDPQSFLQWLDRWIGWIFRPSMLVLSLIFVFVAVLLASLHTSQVGLNSFDFSQIFTVQNIPVIIISMVLVKVLHEMAHGLACVHHGGECHELGVLLIAFFPLLYCDTTDSWRQNRWQRAQVAGAGIYVELMIASVCCLLWVASSPGILNLVFLNLMLICSINTLFVNGNPLLRYDGYYILSDLCDYPNLGPESRQLAGSWMRRVIFGPTAQDDDSLSAERLPLAVYGLASSLYRIVVLVMIVWAVHQFLKQYGLENLTFLVVAPMLIGLVVSLLSILTRKLRSLKGGVTPAQSIRPVLGTLTTVGILALLFLIPLPRSTNAPFVLEPGKCRPVYVTVPGRLTETFLSTEDLLSRDVQAGDLIVALVNEGLQLSLAQSEAQVRERENHLANLEKFRSTSKVANSTIPTIRNSLEAASDRLDTERLQQQRLRIESPIDGTYFPPRNTPKAQSTDRGVSTWSGCPLDKENDGAWVQEQTVLGWVGDQEDLRVVAYVPQAEMELIRVGNPVRIVSSSAPGTVCRGKVSEIGAEVVREVPRELIHNQYLIVEPRDGTYAPVETLYRVSIEIELGNPGALYSTGIVKIDGLKMSIADRLMRLLRQTFAWHAT